MAEAVHHAPPLRLRGARRGRAREWLAGALVWGSAAAVTGAFTWITGDLLWHGLSRLSWSFLVSAPAQAGRSGGIGPILVSTSLVLAVCFAAAVPIGLATAVFLSEFAAQQERLGRWVRRALDVLAGVPSIVFGLFGNALFCKALGLGFSILSGGLTLACMVLPLLIRSTEEGLRAVPPEYRLGAAALGMSKTRTLLHIALPCALPGLTAGLVLGVGRALAETAALLFTSGYVDRMPRSLADSGRVLSLHIYDLSMNVTGGEPNAYASALVLVGWLLAIGCAAALCERWLQRGSAR
jgi:phosphate transport system permease protein